MTTTLSTTAQNIIEDAFRKVGVKALGSALETEQMTIALRALNSLIKQWESRGVKLHTIYDVEVPQYGSKQSYTMKLVTGDVLIDRPMRVVSARRRDNSSLYETPILVIPREEYKQLTIKSSTGPVTQVAYERQKDYGLLYVWPVSDSLQASPTYTVILTIQRAINIFDDSATAPDLPSEMYLAITYGLADILADDCGKPQSGYIRDKAQDYFNQLLMTDQENASIFIQPETR